MRRVRKTRRLVPVALVLCLAGGAFGAGPSSERRRLRDEMEEGQYDARADQKRDEAIAELKKIIPKTRGNQRAELLFQLAELCWEKSRYVIRQAYAKHDEAVARWLAVEAKSPGTEPEPKLETFTREAELYRQEALRLYEETLTEHKSYPRADEVLFALAYCQDELGKVEEALNLYQRLIDEHPRSRYVPDAYVQTGDRWFDANKLEKAQHAYTRALETNNPKIRHYALYKLAWCDINAGDLEKAVARFAEVIDASGPGKGEVALRNEALADVVVAFAQMDGVERAMRFFEQRVGVDGARPFLAKLATGLRDNGRHEDSIGLLRELIRRDPNDPKCPEHQRAIVASFEAMRRRDAIVQEIRTLVDTYAPGTEWAKANAANEAAVREARKIAETAMRTLVTEYHQEAQKTREADTYRLARDIYREYLERFGDAPAAYELRFFYAEILWALNEFEPAAVAYGQVVESDPAGGYSKMAAYNAVLCYEKLVAQDEGRLRVAELGGSQRVDERKKKERMRRSALRTGARAKDAEEQPLTENEAALVEAIDRCVEKYPGEEELALRYKAAFVFYDRMHDVQAARRLGEIIARWPRDEWSRKAADLTLDLLNQREAWEELSKQARAFRDNEPLTAGDAAFAQRLQELVEAAWYKHVDETVYRKQGKAAEAAGLFEGFAQEFPRSKWAAQALMSAVMLHTEARTLDHAVRAAERLLQAYPEPRTATGEPLRTRALAELAGLSTKLADYRSAARWSLELAEGLLASGKSKARLEPAVQGQAADALFNAALWTEATGELEKAADLYGRYARTFAERPDAGEVALRQGKLLLRLAKLPEAADAFAAVARRSPKLRLEALHLEAATQLRLGKEAGPKKAAELRKLIEKLPPQERTGPGASAALAEMGFLELERSFAAFRAVRLDSIARMKKDWDAKLQRIEALEKACALVLQTGEATWGMAALTRLGQAYQDFARAITASPNPPGLSEVDLAVYRAELQGHAYPLEEKAVEIFEKVAEKGRELGVYDEWLVAAQDGLGELKPGTLPPRRVLPLRVP